MKVIIPTASVTRIRNAISTSTPINVTMYEIGDSAEDTSGYTPGTNPTAIGGGQVASGLISADNISVSGDNQIEITIRLDSSQGNYTVGNIGLFDAANNLFCLAIYPHQVIKKMTNAGVTGNELTIRIVLRVTGIRSAVALTSTAANYGSLPIVDDPSDLPAVAAAPFNAYIVRNVAQGGKQEIATKDLTNSKWIYESPGHFRADKFTGLDVGDVVGWNSTTESLH